MSFWKCKTYDWHFNRNMIETVTHVVKRKESSCTSLNSKFPISDYGWVFDARFSSGVTQSFVYKTKEEAQDDRLILIKEKIM